MPKGRSARYYRNLAKATNNTCVLCGGPFKHSGVVNREHMVPAAMGGDNSTVLGAHSACNTWRSKAPLVRSMRLLATIRLRNADAFDAWANSITRGMSFSKKSKFNGTYDPPGARRDELIALFGKGFKRFNKLDG